MIMKTKEVETNYKILVVLMFLSFMVNVVLNYYWAYLIVFQVYRIIARGTAKGVDTSYAPDTSGKNDIELKNEKKQILDPATAKSDV